MRSHRIVLLVTLLMVMAAFGVLADQTNTVKAARPNPSPVKTRFEADHLNRGELKQVLALAKQSGIEDAAEVETFSYMPAGGNAIRVKSKERVDGRNILYDDVVINKEGKPDKKFGIFQVSEPKYTWRLRTYKINQNTVRIDLMDGITADFTDKVMQLIVTKKVRFENDSVRRDFAKLGNFIPASIGQISPNSMNKGGYQMYLSQPPMHILMFRLDKGEVVITGVDEYVV